MTNLLLQREDVYKRQDLENIIKERLNKQASIGFYADLKDKYDNDPHLLQKVTVAVSYTHLALRWRVARRAVWL